MTAPIDRTRRAVLGGAAAVGTGAALAACGGAGTSSTGSSGGGGSGEGGGGADDGSTSTTVKAADVPVGGGTIDADAKVVVTQPTDGEFKAFTAVCTHAGCLVRTVANDKITCPCHGSVYSAEDGSVLRGPASTPLATKKVSVEGDSIVVG